MSIGNTTVAEWEPLRTDETREVEEFLKQHFTQADAYRYNPASIRVRIIDERFRSLPFDERDDLVEPVLEKLDSETESAIMSLVLISPGEEEDSVHARLLNLEFEHPSKSLL
jgi:hypothetical protein